MCVLGTSFITLFILRNVGGFGHSDAAFHFHFLNVFGVYYTQRMEGKDRFSIADFFFFFLNLLFTSKGLTEILCLTYIPNFDCFRCSQCSLTFSGTQDYIAVMQQMYLVIFPVAVAVTILVE